jgi:hypothetical protein
VFDVGPKTEERWVLRARIGVTPPDGMTRLAACDLLATALSRAASEAGIDVDLLQLDLAARPDWDTGGPEDRSGHPA